MVKKPKVRPQRFDDIKQQIEFWDKAVLDTKDFLAHARLSKRQNIRNLRKLEKRYQKQ